MLLRVRCRILRVFDHTTKVGRTFPTAGLQAAANVGSIRRSFDPHRASAAFVEAVGRLGTGKSMASIER